MRRHHAICRNGALSLGLLALAACHREHAASDPVTIVRGRELVATPAPRRTDPAPAVHPTAIPTIAAGPPGPNPQLAKAAFRSPPLPPELVGDGGLVPLPPLPPASAFANQQ